MSDESLQITVNSIQYFLSCHHYLHSLSELKAAPCLTVAGITPGKNKRNPAVNKVWKQVFCGNQSRGLLMPHAPYLVAADVRSHKLKCHPFSLNTGWKTWDTSVEMKHLWCFDLHLPASGGLRRPSAWCLSPPQVFLVETSHWLNFALLPAWRCWIHSKYIQNNAVAASQFNSLK